MGYFGVSIIHQNLTWTTESFSFFFFSFFFSLFFKSVREIFLSSPMMWAATIRFARTAWRLRCMLHFGNSVGVGGGRDIYNAVGGGGITHHKILSFLKLSIYTWGTSVCSSIFQELYESRGGRPGLSVLTSLLVSVDVKIYWTMLRHWSQPVPNMSADIRGH